MLVNKSYVDREAVPNVWSADGESATAKLSSSSKNDSGPTTTYLLFCMAVKYRIWMAVITIVLTLYGLWKRANPFRGMFGCYWREMFRVISSIAEHWLCRTWLINVKLYF